MSANRRSSTETKGLTEHLRDVKAFKSYKQAGFASFAEYAKAKFGICKAYAYRLANGGRCSKANISESTRWRIWERDDFRCHYCGSRKFLSVDHKQAVDCGGSDDDTNLVTACKSCNSKKKAKPYSEFFPPFLQAFQMFKIATGKQ